MTRSLEKPAALASGCDSPSRWGEEEEVAGLGHPRPHFPSGRRPRAGRHTLEGPGRQAVALPLLSAQLPTAGPRSPDPCRFSVLWPEIPNLSAGS